MNEPGSQAWREAEASRLIAFGRAAALPGGGFGWLGNDGRVDQAKPRPLYLNARFTHVFALAHLGGVPGTAALAESGIDALARHYADGEHGGWYAELDHRGEVSDRTKANYAHATVLLATASAAVAGIPGARQAFDAAADVIGEHFWDPAAGRARESWDAAFRQCEPYRGANSNMHSVEAYLAAGDLTGDPAWATRALSIAGRLIGADARAGAWRVPEHFDANWGQVPEYNADRKDDPFRPYGTTPGHSFEWARLLLDLEATLPSPPAWLTEAAVALFDQAVADSRGRDGSPGFVYTIGPDGRPIISARLHWVACEAVLAADALHRRTGEDRYAELAGEWWREIDRYFLDRQGGGWWNELSPAMTPATTIWSGKPDLYHCYQAVLFPSLPLNPGAAVALARSSG